MKKLLITFMCIIMCISAVACGNSAEDGEGKEAAFDPAAIEKLLTANDWQYNKAKTKDEAGVEGTYSFANGKCTHTYVLKTLVDMDIPGEASWTYSIDKDKILLTGDSETEISYKYENGELTLYSSFTSAPMKKVKK